MNLSETVRELKSELMVYYGISSDCYTIEVGEGYDKFVITLMKSGKLFVLEMIDSVYDVRHYTLNRKGEFSRPISRRSFNGARRAIQELSARVSMV